MTCLSGYAGPGSRRFLTGLKPVTRGIVAAISLSVCLTNSALAEQRLTDVERELPQFRLASVDSKEWTVESLGGKPWVINFWATWCPPCIEEIPSMNAAWAKLEGKGVGMIAINAGEGREAVESFLKEFPIDFPALLGDANTLPNWSVKALPTTIIVDAEGRVVFEALGPREWDDEQLLERVLELL